MKKLALALLTVIFYLLGTLASEGTIPLDLPYLQFLVAPLVLAAILSASLAGNRIPWKVGLLCFLLMLISFMLPRIFMGPYGRHIVMARLIEDQTDAQTRIFREKLNSLLAKFEPGESIEPLYVAMNSLEDARNFLESHSAVSSIIWGSKRWINVTMRREAPFELSPANTSAAYLGSYGLKLCTGTDWVGLSYAPEEATLQFLSRFFAGYIPLKEYAAKRPFEAAYNRSEILLEAGRFPARWVATWHKAEALFLAGNYRFVELLQKNTFDPEEMRQLIDLYSAAIRLVHISQNAGLSAAINNNLAVSAFINSRMTGDKEDRKWALKLLKVVVSFGKNEATRREYGNQWQVVKDNIRWIQSHSRKGKKKIKAERLTRRKQKNDHRRHHPSTASPRP